MLPCDVLGQQFAAEMARTATAPAGLPPAILAVFRLLFYVAGPPTSRHHSGAEVKAS